MTNEQRFQVAAMNASGMSIDEIVLDTKLDKQEVEDLVKERNDKRKTISEATKRAVVEWYQSGHTEKACAKKFGISPASAHRIIAGAKGEKEKEPATVAAVTEPKENNVQVQNTTSKPESQALRGVEVIGLMQTMLIGIEKNKTVRHAIITGETGEYGGYRKGTRMKLADRWLQLFGGYANEEEGCNYGIPPEGVKVSSQCCYWLKEKPADDWAKEHHSAPFLGLMASEGGRRQKSLMINGCNYFGKSTTRSAPFAIFMRQDILTLALEMDEYYREHIDEFAKTAKLRPNEEMPDSIIPAVYGEITRDFGGKLRTTKAQRTGCSMCGFGIHIEKRPHRFDRLRERNFKEWEFWMFRCCKDADGTPFGWGRVLDYIGVEWRDEVFDMDNAQLSFDDI